MRTIAALLLLLTVTVFAQVQSPSMGWTDASELSFVTFSGGGLSENVKRNDGRSPSLTTGAKITGQYLWCSNVVDCGTSYGTNLFKFSTSTGSNMTWIASFFKETNTASINAGGFGQYTTGRCTIMLAFGFQYFPTMSTAGSDQVAISTLEATNRWVRYACTYNGSTTNAVGYTNGASAGTAAIISPTFGNVGDAFTLGQIHQFNGGCPVRVANARFINRVLTAAEIKEDFQKFGGTPQ